MKSFFARQTVSPSTGRSSGSDNNDAHLLPVYKQSLSSRQSDPDLKYGVKPVKPRPQQQPYPDDQRMAAGSNRICVFLCLALLIVIILVIQVDYIRVGVLSYSRHTLCISPPTHSAELMKRGRSDSAYPSPRCCADADCIKAKESQKESQTEGEKPDDNSNNNNKKHKHKHQQRVAILTTIRSANYLSLLQNLACTVKQSNPSIPFVIATVRGDLDLHTEVEIRKLGKLIYWPEFKVENKLQQRYTLNWVKIRAWEMDENYDALLMIDADTAVIGDVTHLFDLPAHFATVLDEDKSRQEYNALGRMQGGVIFLRPCRAVAAHMIQLLTDNPDLHFTRDHAEQSFFDWYFRYDRWTLPVRYNSISFLLENEGNTSRSGLKPVIVHFAGEKPFFPNPELIKEEKWAVCVKNHHHHAPHYDLPDTNNSSTSG
jgi:Glycosyl transferase family 8